MTRFRWLLVVTAVVIVATLTALAIWRPWVEPPNGAPPTQLDRIAVVERDKTGGESYSLGGEGSITSRNENTLEIRNGRVVANGKDGGPLKSNDSVLLDEEGRLFVNGQQRTPQ